MSSSPTPAAYPGSDGEPSAARGEKPAKLYPEEAAPPEQTIPVPKSHIDVRSEAYQTELVATPSVPDVSPSSINTDVRRHGISPFLTGVTVGILVFILGFLIAFAYLVVTYLRYTDG